MLRSHVDAVPISTVALFLGNVLLSDAAAQLSSHHTSVTFFQHRTHLHLWPSCIYVCLYGLKNNFFYFSGSSFSSALFWVCAVVTAKMCTFIQALMLFLHYGLTPHCVCADSWYSLDHPLSLALPLRTQGWNDQAEALKSPDASKWSFKMISLKHAHVTD